MGRAFLFVEGAFAQGGCFCSRFFLIPDEIALQGGWFCLMGVVLLAFFADFLTESPSRDMNTLR